MLCLFAYAGLDGSNITSLPSCDLLKLPHACPGLILTVTIKTESWKPRIDKEEKTMSFNADALSSSLVQMMKHLTFFTVTASSKY